MLTDQLDNVIEFIDRALDQDQTLTPDGLAVLRDRLIVARTDAVALLTLAVPPGARVPESTLFSGRIVPFMSRGGSA